MGITVKQERKVIEHITIEVPAYFKDGDTDFYLVFGEGKRDCIHVQFTPEGQMLADWNCVTRASVADAIKYDPCTKDEFIKYYTRANAFFAETIKKAIL